MIFISINASSGAARSVAAAGTICACRRLVRGRQMTGGKGEGGKPLFFGPLWRYASIPGGAARFSQSGSGNCGNPPGNERRKGRKGRKPRFLRKYGPCRRCRETAETSGNSRKSFWGLYGGGKVFSGAGIGPPRRAVGDWRIACGNCGNPSDIPTGFWRRPSETSQTSETSRPVIG